MLTPSCCRHQFFKPLPPSCDISSFLCIFMDGSSFYKDGEHFIGFGLYVLSLSDSPLSFSCLPHYAELTAVARALEHFASSAFQCFSYLILQVVYNVLTECLTFWHTHSLYPPMDLLWLMSHYFLTLLPFYPPPSFISSWKARVKQLLFTWKIPSVTLFEVLKGVRGRQIPTKSWAPHILQLILQKLCLCQ